MKKAIGKKVKQKKNYGPMGGSLAKKRSVQKGRTTQQKIDHRRFAWYGDWGPLKLIQGR